MLISFQESALKDLKKIDKTEAKKILEAIKNLSIIHKFLISKN